MRYVVSQALNTWIVRDKELLKAHKRSVIAEFNTKREADDFCGQLNAGLQPKKQEA